MLENSCQVNSLKMRILYFIETKALFPFRIKFFSMPSILQNVMHHTFSFYRNDILLKTSRCTFLNIYLPANQIYFHDDICYRDGFSDPFF